MSIFTDSINRHAMRTAGALLVVCAAAATPAIAQVPDACRAAFDEAGAAPFTESCRLDAAVFQATLANFFCGIEEIDEYCSTLPPYVEDDEDGTDDDNGAGDDGTDDDNGAGDDDGTDDDNGTDDDGTGDDDETGEVVEGDGLPIFDEDSLEIIVGESGESGESSDTAGSGLEMYNENQGTGTGVSGNCSEATTIDWNGNFDFVFGTGLSLLELPGNLPGYDVVGGVVNGFNIVSAQQHAEQTGDTGPLFAVVSGIVGLFGIVDEPYAAVSDFINTVNGVSSDCQ